jgi:hypothetical protein
MPEEGLPPEYLCGIELFNAGKFFACHEALEKLWLKATGLEREFLQALIQAAVALHHYQNGNYRGAASLYRRARKRLGDLPPQMMSLDTAALARELEEFFATAAASLHKQPSLPQIHLLKLNRG